MGLIVQKYGGSSVADSASIKRIAQNIVETHKLGNQVVVVVSAMGDTTDDLLDLAKQIVTGPPPARELDMLLTAGERISMALTAMAINELSYAAQSFTGSQAGMITDDIHGKARIVAVDPARIRKTLATGTIAIVAGFQGISNNTGNITTLGRGGSDTTAVALSAALNADVCEIYTDVDGVYTADPRIVHNAKKINYLSSEEMLEMSTSGAKILHPRCVEYAKRYEVLIHVRSSFNKKIGTWIVPQNLQKNYKTNKYFFENCKFKENSMEKVIVSGVAHDSSETKITIIGVPNIPGKAAHIFSIVANSHANIDMIVQNVSVATTGRTDISFTLPIADSANTLAALKSAQKNIGFESLQFDNQIGKLSIIGIGMRSNPGVSAKFFDALCAAGINIEMISTSDIRVSVVIRIEHLDTAVKVVHKAFELEGETEAIVYAGSGR